MPEADLSLAGSLINQNLVAVCCLLSEREEGLIRHKVDFSSYEFLKLSPHSKILQSNGLAFIITCLFIDILIFLPNFYISYQ